MTSIFGDIESVVPSPWTIIHIARRRNGPEDDHGNKTMVIADPVVRKAMSIQQTLRRASSHEVLGQQYAQRSDTILHIAVADVTPYKDEDQIIIWPEFDGGGEWVRGTGVAYWVDGIPNDERVGPWPNLLAVFGGVMHVRRVT
jgi:hypothetical protein